MPALPAWILGRVAGLRRLQRGTPFRQQCRMPHACRVLCAFPKSVDLHSGFASRRLSFLDFQPSVVLEFAINPVVLDFDIGVFDFFRHPVVYHFLACRFLIHAFYGLIIV